jgi:hypothetical protein
MTTYQVSSTVAPGTEYMAVIAVNEAGVQSEAQAVVGRVSVIPTDASGIFASNYLRYYVSPDVLQNNIDASSTDRYYDASVFSNVQFETDATSTVIEYTDTLGSDALAVLVNGRPYQYITALSTNVVTQTAVPLPSGRKTVEIVNGVQSETEALGPVYGSFVRAVYFPEPSNTQVLQQVQKERRLVIYGDSIIVGGAAPNPTTQSTIALLQNSYNGTVVADAWGYRALLNDTATGSGAERASRASYKR